MLDEDIKFHKEDMCLRCGNRNPHNLSLGPPTQCLLCENGSRFVSVADMVKGTITEPILSPRNDALGKIPVGETEVEQPLPDCAEITLKQMEELGKIEKEYTVGMGAGDLYTIMATRPINSTELQALRKAFPKAEIMEIKK